MQSGMLPHVPPNSHKNLPPSDPKHNVQHGLPSQGITGRTKGFANWKGPFSSADLVVRAPDNRRQGWAAVTPMPERTAPLGLSVALSGLLSFFSLLDLPLRTAT